MSSRVRRNERVKNQNFFDYTLLFVVMFIVIFGLVMIYSTSSYEAGVEIGDSAFYLKKQLFATVLGVFVMVVMINVDYHAWQRFAIPGLVMSFILVVLVKTPLGITANGATRWIKVGPLSDRKSVV